VANCGCIVGSILREAALVAAIGVAFAFVGNQISPRGLALARNYFPTGITNMVRAVVGADSLAGALGINSTTSSLAQQLAAQMRQNGLQLIARREAVQLFYDSHLKNNAIVFIDARNESQYQEAHIPGAYEFDPYHPETSFPTVLPVCRTAEKIVIYCSGGNCDDSESAALLLRDVGIANGKIFVYGGGITEWTNNGLPVETGARNIGNTQSLNQ